MQLYAYIANGIVQQIVSPVDDFEFDNCFSADFIADCVACDDTVQQGWTFTAPSTFSAPAPPPAPTAAELAIAALGTGLQIVSTGTPTLNATYALDSTTLDQVGALARDCAAGLGFPLGAQTFSYPDLSGNPHTFTPAAIQDLYKALRDYVFNLTVVISGQSNTLPPASTTIA